MNRAVIGCLMLNAVLAGASNLKEATVKLVSARCGISADERRGSGFLFSYQGSVFVVTSDHVPHNGTAGICNSVENKKIGKAKAKLVLRDWENGLALLILSEKISATVPELISIETPQDKEALVVGFPFHANGQPIQSEGMVVTWASDRKVFSKQTEIMEVVGARGEYGMSGGPVLSKDADHFLGILSHQAVVIQPGKPSKLVDIGPEVNPDQLLVIPGAAVMDWAKKVIDGNDELRFIWLPGTAGKLPGGSLIGGGFQFIPNALAGTSDGVGVGGDEGSEDPGKLLADWQGGLPGVDIQLNPENLTEAVPIPARAEWWERVKKALLLGSKVRVLYFAKKNPMGLPEKLGIPSLAGFVRFLDDPEWNPITVIVPANGNISDILLLKKAALRKEADKLKVGILELRETLKNGEAPEVVRQLLIKLSMVSEVLFSEAPEMVDSAFLVELENETDSWSWIFNQGVDSIFQKGVSLLGILHKARLEHERLFMPH